MTADRSMSNAFLHDEFDDMDEAECYSHSKTLPSQATDEDGHIDPYAQILLINGCQIHLSVDFDYLKNEGPLDCYDQKWNLLTPDELAQCMHISFNELNRELSGIVTCLRCRSCVKNVLRRSPESEPDEDPIYDPQIYPLCWHGPSCIALYDEFIQSCHSSRTCTLLKRHSYSPADIKSRKAKQTLCGYHKRCRQKLDCSWVDLWDKLNNEQRRKITQLQRIPFEKRLKRYVNCPDCFKQIYAAYALISSISDQVEFNWDESRLQHTNGFSLTVTEEKIFLPMQLKHIAELMSKAEDEVNWHPERDHTRGWRRSLHMVQVVLGMMLWEQFESLWLQLRREEHTIQCFVRVCFKCFQKKIELKVHEKQGAAQLEALIDSLDNEKNAENIKKKKKRRNKKKAKKKMIVVSVGVKCDSDTDSCGTEKKELDESQDSQKENIQCNPTTCQPSTCYPVDPCTKHREPENKETNSPEPTPKFSEKELNFLEALGWSEQNRNSWEAEPYVEEVPSIIFPRDREKCQQRLLNGWKDFCGVAI